MNLIAWQDVFRWFDADFCLRLTQAMLHFLWQGSAVVFVYFMFDSLRPKVAAKSKYVVAVAALLLMAACLPATMAILPAGETPVPPTPAAMVALEAVNQIGQPNIPQPQRFVSQNSVDETLIAPRPAQASTPANTSQVNFANVLASVSPYATAFYLCGAALMLLRVSAGLWGGQRLRRAATLCQDPAILQLVAQQSCRLRLRFVPKVAWCARLASPVVVGVLQPIILLPPALSAGLTNQQLSAVLLHELAHIRRYDLAINLVQRLIEAALFFHPAVWWLSRRVGIERENACDDLALAADGSKLQYADALVRAAELCEAAANHDIQSVAALAATGGNSSQFKRRMLRLMGMDERPRLRLSTASLAISTALFALLLIAPNAWRGAAMAENQAASTPTDAKPDRKGSVIRGAESKPVVASFNRDAILEEIKRLRGEWMPTPNDRKYLSLRGSKVDDGFLGRLKQLDGLEWLWLYEDVAVTDVGMKNIGQMKGLTNLQIQSDHITDAGLQSIAELEQLSILVLSSPKLTNASLSHLHKLPKLAHLDISCEKIDDDGLKELSNFAALRHLTLRSPQITDQGLAIVGRMRNLAGISLSDASITDAGFEQLQNCTHLTNVAFDNARATGEGIKHLAKLQKLNQFTLTGPNVGNVAFAELHRFPKLTRVRLGTGYNSREESQITDEALRALSNTKSLTHVSFDNTRVSDVGLSYLSGLPNLQIVSFSRTPELTQAGISKFKATMPKVSVYAFEPLPKPLKHDATKAENDSKVNNLPDNSAEKSKAKTSTQTKSAVDRDTIVEEIKKLGGQCEVQQTIHGEERLAVRVPGLKTDDAFVERLKQLENIEQLELYNVSITDAGMKYIGEMKSLTNLQIQSEHLTDAGLKSLEGLEKLELLNLVSSQLTDAGLIHLQKLPKLVRLLVQSDKISDDGLRQLLSIESLRELRVFGQGVTDDGLRHLEGDQKLGSIALTSARITDGGLVHLKEAKSLVGLSFYSPKITDAGLAALGEMAQLKGLSLHDAPITDVGLQHLKNLTQISALHLSNTQATGEGLKHLAGLQELAQLTLTGPEVNIPALPHCIVFQSSRTWAWGVERIPSRNRGLQMKPCVVWAMQRAYGSCRSTKQASPTPDFLILPACRNCKA